MAKMDERLEKMVERYREINDLMMQSDVVSDRKTMAKLGREQNELTPIVETYEEYKKAVEELEEAKVLSKEEDKEIREMAQMELEELEPKIQNYLDRLELLLVPKDPNDSHNAILEIRGAAGGDEAQLFAGDLLNMYTHYATKQGWKVEVLDANVTDIGGYKEVTIMISGQKVYAKLKYENGAHRVQRVPETESQGRIHTSTATVVVMPEAEEIDYELDENDIRVDIYHASGAGGQHVNKTASAVRMTHEPTGIVVAMQDERSQLKNREKAMKVLRARVFDKVQSEAQSAIDSERKLKVGTGDRSERIRTYNFPQSRVTDHRIGLTIQKLDQILSGELDEIVDALVLYEQTEKLEALNGPAI